MLRLEFNDVTKIFRRDIQGCLNIHHINWQETTPFRMKCSHPAMLIHTMSCPRSAGKAREVARCLTIVWTQLLATGPWWSGKIDSVHTLLAITAYQPFPIRLEKASSFSSTRKGSRSCDWSWLLPFYRKYTCTWYKDSFRLP